MDAATQNLIALMGIYALMASSLALVNGVAGQFSLGHAAFQAVGAYVAAVGFALAFSGDHGQVASPAWGWACAWGAIALGAAVAAGAGWLVSLPCLRLRGDYLAIATLGFNEIVGVVIRAQGRIGRVDPGGPRGFNDIPRGIAGGTLEILAALALVLFAAWRLLQSRRGRAFEAVREDEVAAEAVGIDSTQTKVLAFVLSAAIAGLAGGLYAFHYGSISDRAFDVGHSIDYVVMVLLGGGTPLGAAVAAAALTAVNDQFRGLEGGRMVAYGFLLVWLMVARAQGLTAWALGSLRRGNREDTSQEADDRGKEQGGDAQASSAPAGRGDRAGGGPLLEMRGVTARFGGLVAVEGLDLEVRPGECVGLIGPNGAGKSTVFNLIGGVYRPTAGTIGIGGRPVGRARPHRVVAAGACRTFQNIRLFDGLTVLDNVRAATLNRYPVGLTAALLGREERAAVDAECRALLERFGLGAIAARRAGSLPYGARRRLEIARALATGPRLLLLDEPAAGMNPAEKDDLRGRLTALRSGPEGIALLVVEHDMPFVMGLCDRVVVLNQGRKIAEGTPEQVRADPAVIDAYLGPEDLA